MNTRPKALATALTAVVVACGSPSAAVAASKPSIRFTQRTAVLDKSGKRISEIRRATPFGLDVRYSARVPRSWKNAAAVLEITLTRDTWEMSTVARRTPVRAGRARWIVRGDGIVVPASYPAGRYNVVARLTMTRGTRSVSRAVQRWTVIVR